MLVTGGIGDDGSTALASAELYDLATGVWTATGSMATARAGHTATLLSNGKVLVAAGFAVHPARYAHTATLLLNGQVLVSGGVSHYGYLTLAQLYKSAPEMLGIQ